MRNDVRWQWLGVLLWLGSLTSSPSWAATITVTSTGDTIAVDTFVTLREAIGSINAGANVNADVVPVGAYGTSDTVLFNIPGAPGTVHTIQPTSGFTLSVPMFIDGYSQPGASANTLAVGDDSVHVVEVDGTNAGAVSAFTLPSSASGTRVQGLVVNRFSGFAFGLSSVDACVFQGNFIGTDVTGAVDRGNGGAGIQIFGDSDDNRIGGLSPGERNVISGNTGSGIRISQASDATVIQGNYIGTDAAGAAALFNDNGILILGGNDTVIGGTVAGARNVISGNFHDGVDIDNATAVSGASGTTIQGNFIGTNAAGTSAIPNRTHGVRLEDATSVVTDTTVGGTVAGAGNIIAFNGQNGVAVASAVLFNTGNAILGNSIHSNDDIGIDLNDDEVTPNDPGDGDPGDNLLQNYPVLASAETDGVSLDVVGNLDSTANTTFRIEYFSNAVCDAAGEGETFLGFQDATTDGAGLASVDITLPAVTPGLLISATATDPNDNTSEFSPCVLAAAPNVVTIPVATPAGLAALALALAVAGAFLMRRIS